MTRSGDHLIFTSNSLVAQPRYRALILNELEGQGVSGSGSAVDPLVIPWELDPIYIGYEVYTSDDHHNLGSFLYSADVLVRQATGNISDIQDLLVNATDEIGSIIQLSSTMAMELSTEPKYLSLSRDVFLQGGNWYEVVVGDALGLYANDEIVYTWAESEEGVIITPIYLGDVQFSRDFIYKFTVTWGQHPRDLDSYLWTPEIDDVSYVVSYADRGSENRAPFAQLDLDDIDSWGPESITLTQLFPGTYRYSIHHYAGWEDDSLDIAHSQAEVRIADPNGIVQVFNVPEAPCDTWWYWHVVEIDGATGELTIINALDSEPPGTMLMRSQPAKTE